MALVICAGLAAQTSQTGAPADRLKVHVVPLMSDACPAVHGGERISLDWYPGFDLDGIVTGIKAFALYFSPLSQNGITPTNRPIQFLGQKADSVPTVNGFFHIEMNVPRHLRPGVYQLVNARASAETVPEYDGKPLAMTNSPVDGRFCITVTPNQPEAQPQSDSSVR